MAENGIERTLGEILATQKATNKSIDNYRKDIKEVFGEIKTNSVTIGENKTSIKSIKEDLDDNIRPAIQTAQNKGMATGGIGIITGIGAIFKDLFGGN